MHGRGGENSRPSLHMWSVPTRTVAGDRVAVDSFCKDGRKISVGDCALFKPPQDSPPFIGIILWLTSKDKNLQLSVNWLYRPADVKLGKGFLLDAAPNEVFYSFHRDEIPAASLLHPCKVAFLPKDIELPPGISSFVCRRVYDISNKCLRWLTDPDYIDERQEELDQLLFKTRKEMHATLQSGGYSPKAINGPTATSQLKPGSDNVNCASSFPSHTKRKKRDHGDQGLESVKRERHSKTDDGDSNQLKADSILKSEITNITEKGGLVDFEGVEKLVKLMQPTKVERKMDLVGRSLLVGVISVTDKFDCLTQFVQLRGLRVLDEWLQDIHKGKIDAGTSLKDGDKYVEEFLLVLLRALDKLPVNLHALQMCNIGRSVNHLRTHKNPEIQKKARSLVDTWKKRVEAEMNILDSKSGSSQAVSWPSKSRIHEVPHGGNRHFGGSSEISKKNSVSLLPASKNSSPKPLLVETTTKSASSYPGPIKSALSPGSGKDGQLRISVGCASDLPSTPAREEKSSSSSQSHNYSQSLSGKEDARSSTAGSMSVHKISSGTSRHRKSINGGPGPAVSGVQRESGSSRTASLHSASTSERMSGLTCEKVLDVPLVEGRNHKLIVKIPNRGRSPTLSTSGGFSEDPSIMNCRALSPLPSEKHDHFDRNMKEKNGVRRVSVTSEVNTESWQSNDFKDVLGGFDEGDVSPDAVHNEERSRAVDNTRKSAEVSKAVSSSPWDELTSEKNLRGSVPFTNATQPSLSARDDVGMNLLASVAAREMSKANLVSPTDSSGNHVIFENPCTGNSSSSPVDTLQSQSDDGAENDKKLHASSQSLDSGGRKTTSCSFKDMPGGEHNEHSNSFSVDLHPTEDRCLGTSEKGEMRDAASAVVSPASIEKAMDGEFSERDHVEKKAITTIAPEDIPGHNGCNSLVAEDKDNAGASMEDEKLAVEVQSSHLSFRKEAQNKNGASEGFNNGGHSEQNRPSPIAKSENVERADDEMLQSSGLGKDLIPENHNELKDEKVDELDTGTLCQAGREKPVQDTNVSRVIEGSVVAAQKNECMEEDVESKEAQEQCCGDSVSNKESPLSTCQETERHVRLRAFKAGGDEIEEREEHACTTADASESTEGVADVDAKLKFDLNERFTVEDGKLGNLISLTASECTSSIHVINPLPFPVSSASSCLPASITVAAAAKGRFVPIQDLLRSKGELGWKGSAATSAFRPAEPRKVLEMPLASSSLPLPDATDNKRERPMLDFDLNVPDERILDDMICRDSAMEARSLSEPKSNPDLARNELMGSAAGPSSGRFELDLNRLVEANDMGQYPSTSSSSRLESPLLQVKSTSLGGFPNGEVQRDFDLNNGPVLDEDTSEQLSFSQRGRGSLQSWLPVGGIRMNSADIGNLSSWYPPGNVYSAVTIPSIFHDAGNRPFPIVTTQKMVGPSTGGTLTPDVYRGPVLSSSPAVPYPSTAFQYPVSPFGTSFPLTPATFAAGSTQYLDSSAGGRFCLPGVTSQLLGPAGAVSSHVQRPYMVGLPDSSSNGGMENNRKWGRQGLDLNAGPGGVVIEGRDETMLMASRQFSVANSQAQAEEQARMHHLAGGVLKRKDPEGAWDIESLRYKQSSWQ